MKPDWDKLAEEFADSKTVLIADVDCTVEKSLCSKFGVRGYPTIKYFTASTAADGDKYEGGRDFASLKKFASENLGPSCSAENFDLCNDEQKAILTEALALTPAERAAFISEQQGLIDAAEEAFKTLLADLQAQYKKAMEDKDETIAAISPKLSLYRSIKSDGDAHDEL